MIDNDKDYDVAKKLGENLKSIWGLLVLSLFFQSKPSYALYELTGGFGYSKQVYGNSRQNSMVSRTYSGSLAIYLFGATGVELNYSQNEDIITEHENIDLGSGYSIASTQNKVMTTTHGVGIRQALAPERFFLIPVLSLGYAKQTKTGEISYTVNDSVADTSRILKFVRQKEVSDSVFATFLIKFAFTKALSLNASVRSVFKAFKFNEYRDSLKYEAGFSWVF